MGYKIRDESLRKFHDVEALRASGVPLEEAVKKVGMSSATYYHVKKSLESTPKQKKVKTPKFIDLKTPEPRDSVAIVVCSVSNLKSILKSLT